MGLLLRSVHYDVAEQQPVMSVMCLWQVKGEVGPFDPSMSCIKRKTEAHGDTDQWTKPRTQEQAGPGTDENAYTA